MRPIDADKLECVSATMPQDASEDYKEGYGDGMNYVLEIIDEQPTIDPVKHGRWIISDGCVCCSECGEPNMEWNYCPNCGAYMRGEKDG